jgi:hypothetical protein
MLLEGVDVRSIGEEKWGRNVSSSVTSSDGVIIKFQKQCMQKAIQGKLS